MIRAVIFDWGDTLMRDDATALGPMVTWPQVEAVDGAAMALTELRATKLALCVASNAGASDAELMGQALARVDLRRYFDHLWTSKELGAAKPDPQFFREVVRRVGFELHECIMVGNDYTKDICGAKSAGLRTVWLKAATGIADNPAVAADTVIRQLCELPAAIRLLAEQP